MAEANWYVVHTYSGYENKVKESIEMTVRNRGLEEQIIGVEVPLERAVEVKNGTKKTVDRKMLPGYVLVHMEMNDETWYVVRNPRGVTGFVGSASKPIPLTKEEIDQLGIDRQAIEVNFKPGDTVKVTDGAFEGFTGVIDEVDVDKQRLTVIVTMFGRETPINLEFDEAEVVKD